MAADTSDQRPPSVYQTTVASSISICLGKIFTHPLDTIKAKLQVDRSKFDPSQAGHRPSVFQIAKKNGAKNLYQGFSVAVIGSLPAGAVYMTTYELLKPKLKETIPKGKVWGSS